jgi:phosphatidylinositol glycan class A protein
LLHAHQAFSSMAQESILHAATMGIKCVFTDHSLFSFENTRFRIELINGSAILTNKLLKFTLSQQIHVICVSHTSKENTVLRAALNPYTVSVIPNAIVSNDFTPDESKRDLSMSIIHFKLIII